MFSPIDQTCNDPFRMIGIGDFIIYKLIPVYIRVGRSIEVTIFYRNARTTIVAKTFYHFVLAILLCITQYKNSFAVFQPLHLYINISVAVDNNVTVIAKRFNNTGGAK